MTIEEMEDAVATAIGLSDELRAVPHGEGPRSQFDYELAWVRTYLKKASAVENSERGVWRLTPTGAAMSDGDYRCGTETRSRAGSVAPDAARSRGGSH